MESVKNVFRWVMIIGPIAMAAILIFTQPRNLVYPRFLDFAFAIGLTGLAISAWALWHGLPKAEKQTKETARQIASARWYVKGGSIWKGDEGQFLDNRGWRHFSSEQAGHDRSLGDGAVLKLESEGSRRQQLTLAVRPYHPSIGELSKLNYLDLVEFDFREKPLECALDIELCAYLVLKSRQSWS